MDFTLTDPPLPSFARYARLQRIGKKKTILRQMEYEIIQDLSLSGRWLDFGGGQKAEYLPFLDHAGEILSVNIDAEFDPTHIVAPGAPLPFADDSFDGIITFNTLEHVFDDRGALAELTRILKPGGTLHIIVPFMYPVHGHPDDYNRHTPSWWQQSLADLGYAQATLLPITFGRTTTARLIRGRGEAALRPLTDFLAATRDILLAKAFFLGQSHYTGRRGARVWASAPGFFITAIK